MEGPRDVVMPRLLLIMAVFALTVIGLVMVYSSSSIEAINEGTDAASYLVKQMGIAAFSIIMCTFIAVKIPYYYWLDKWLDIFWGVSVVLLLLTALIGTVGLGAQRWLVLGPVNFQPSELAKVAFLLMSSRIMYQARTDDLSMRSVLLRIGVLVVLPLLVLFVTESDLGTTLICAVGILTVLWLSDVPFGVFLVILIALIVFGIAAVLFVGYRSDRMVFLNPEADYYGSGYQLTRSFYAFGEGGLFGVGLGNSTEKYLYLPEAETDFIFSIIGEEMGMIGAALVVVLFLVLLYAGLRIARNAPDLFGTMIAGSCTVTLVFQAFLNIGCVLGMLPTTGKPLPFISSGGSSLIGSFLLVGIILSVSFASGDTSGIYSRRREDLRVVRAGSGASGASRKGRAPSSGSFGGARGPAARSTSKPGSSSAKRSGARSQRR